MMVLVWVLTVSLAGALGFVLGARFTTGRAEVEAEAFVERESEREGVRLNRIVMRR